MSWFIAFLFVTVFIPRLIFLFQKPKDIEFSRTEKTQIQTATIGFKKARKQKTFRKSSKKAKRFTRPERRFDPNNYAPSDWMKLGLSQKQADVIIRFGKGGFYSHEDLRKVFVISDELFELIKDSISYPERKISLTEPVEKSRTYENSTLIDLNTANEEDLTSIRGIGPFFAKQILKRREQLGGYHDKKQLLEVWKFDQEKLDQIEKYIEIKSSGLKQIQLNQVELEQLKQHPYIDWNLANSILKMRNQRGGKFQSIEEIRESKLMTPEIFQKLKPYLSL